MLTVEEQLRRLVQIRAGGAVERCHGIPHAGSYDNGSHQWGVAMLMWILWPEDFARLVIYCLTHDVPEAWVGDIPATTKRYDPGVRGGVERLERAISYDLGLPYENDLSPDDWAKLKACDSLELYIWCVEQANLGNINVRDIITQLERFFEHRPLPPRAAEFHAAISHNRLAVLPRRAGVIEDLCENLSSPAPEPASQPEESVN